MGTEFYIRLMLCESIGVCMDLLLLVVPRKLSE